MHPPPPSRLRRGLLAGALLGTVGLAASQAQRRAWPPGEATPPLVLPQLDGSPWDLADARGRVVLLNFWATWCEPCRTEMPSLERLAARHAADGLRVVAVNYRESAATIRAYVERSGLSLTVLRDADGRAARAWGARMFPTTLLVGRDGRARASVRGEADWDGAPALDWVRELL